MSGFCSDGKQFGDEGDYQTSTRSAAFFFPFFCLPSPKTLVRLNESKARPNIGRSVHKGIGIVSWQSETPRETAEVEKWILEARQGNREALGRLLDLCRHYLLLTANKQLTPALWTKVAPSDVVQDTLLEAGRDFPGFLGGSEAELLAWLRGILHNNVLNARRHFETAKRRVDREVPLKECPDDELLKGMSSPTETPSREAQAREQDAQLQWAIQQLPEHYRRVILWRSTETLTFAQMAEKLGSTTDAVRKLWGRAVEELAKLLGPSQ
jgi:RNA polymerase sigma-70 factor, ECF subfamily